MHLMKDKEWLLERVDSPQINWVQDPVDFMLSQSLEEPPDNDETDNGSLQAEAIGEPQAVRRFTEEKAFTKVLFDCLRDSLSEMENQVLTLRLRSISWKEVRQILGLRPGEMARVRQRINTTVQMVLGLVADEPL